MFWASTSLLWPVFLLPLFVLGAKRWPIERRWATRQALSEHITKRKKANLPLLAKLDDARFFDEEDLENAATLRDAVAWDGVMALYGSNRVIILDPEDIAEGGVGEALLRLGESATRRGFKLRNYSQSFDEHGYSVNLNGVRYEVHANGQNGSGIDGWGLAVEAVCRMVNDHLWSGTEERLHFFGGGNDGFFLFLTPEIAREFRKPGIRRGDWPFIPDRKQPELGRRDMKPFRSG